MITTLKNVSTRDKKNGGKYLLVTLNTTPAVSGPVWDYKEEFAQLAPGSIVAATWTTSMYNGKEQAKFTEFRLATPEEKAANMATLQAANTSATDSSSMYTKAMNIIASIEDADYRRLCDTVYKKYAKPLCSYPAAKSVHHNYVGGLLEHSLTMAETAIAIYPIYKDVPINRSLIVTGCLLHDIAKIYEFTVGGDMGLVTDYSTEGVLLGHLYMGAKMISNICQELQIPHNKTVMLEHLIISHHGEPEWGAIKKPSMAEAILLHYIDMINANMKTCEQEYADIPEGKLGEKASFALGTRIYHPVSTPVPTAAPSQEIPQPTPTMVQPAVSPMAPPVQEQVIPTPVMEEPPQIPPYESAANYMENSGDFSSLF